jgi:membrane protease YdiL (CAAX protease family)
MNTLSEVSESQETNQVSENIRLAPSWFNPRSKVIMLLEILVVFSPVLICILGYRLLEVSNPMIFIGAIWVANIVMLLIIWMGIKWRGDNWGSIGLHTSKLSGKDLLWGGLKAILILILAIIGFVLGSIIMLNIVGSADAADMTQYNYMQDNLPMLLFSLAGAYVVSSFGEEVVYRGFLITRLQAIFGDSGKLAVFSALVFSSIIFGFAHFEWGATGIVQTIGMGFALGGAFLFIKRKLWPLIIAHAIMDTVLFVQLYLAPVTGG